MVFNKKEWRIIERALLKFSCTVHEGEDAPETNAEIDALWRKVHDYRREHNLLVADEKRRAP